MLVVIEFVGFCGLVEFLFVAQVNLASLEFVFGVGVFFDQVLPFVWNA